MRSIHSLFVLGAVGLIASAPAAAQQVAVNDTARTTSDSAPAVANDSGPAAKPEKDAKSLLVPTIQIQHIRPNDQRGLNVFEAPKEELVPFTGFKLSAGAAFTQQFQGLRHGNTAVYKAATDATGKVYNANQLITIGKGFNNAVANAYLNAQLAKGIRVAMTGYLSSRHHNETWVKDGYLLIDDSPIDYPLLNTVMQYLTVKAGHFEINYGDTHFRRTDNGQAMFNPLVGNYILDAFTTQVGGEVMVRAKGFMAMGGITNGEVRGTILNPVRRAPAYIGKVGYDKQITPLVRTRLTGSLFSQARSANQTLFSGDRAGSRYYDVLENTVSTESAQFTSGAVTPFSGANGGLHAAVINPFVKVGPVEYFGNFERAKGKSIINNVAEKDYRTVEQISNELTVRFLRDQLFVSGRYNTVSGRLAGIANDINVKRSQVGGGWFITPLVLMKGEYVTQKYLDFPTTDIRNGGKFNGFMVEASVAF